MLFGAGDQLPVMPLVEVKGNAGNALPEQIGNTCVNVGAWEGFTVIAIVAVEAHCPAVGVKV